MQADDEEQHKIDAKESNISSRALFGHDPNGEERRRNERDKHGDLGKC